MRRKWLGQDNKVFGRTTAWEEPTAPAGAAPPAAAKTAQAAAAFAASDPVAPRRPRTDLPPVSLPAKTEAAIWKTKTDYELALQRSGMPRPWELIEKLADELLEEMLQTSAEKLFEACDDAVEQVVEGEVAIVAPPQPSA